VLLNDTLSLQKKGLGWHMAEDGLGSLVQHLAGGWFRRCAMLVISAISHLAFFLPLRHQNTKFHEGKALTLCSFLYGLWLLLPPHEKLL
jgi:hypothetical protein